MSDNNSFMLKHNPLGIHSQDGKELILSKAPRKAPVSIDIDDDALMCKAREASYSFVADNDVSTDSLPTSELSVSDLNISQPLPAKKVDPSSQYYNIVPQAPIMHSRETHFKSSQQTGLNQAKSSSEEPSSEKEIRTANDMDLSSVSLDFGGQFKMDGLGRQNTITARRMPPSESSKDIPLLTTRVGPSANPLLIQRLRSIRRKMSPGSAPVPSDDEDDDKLDGGLSEDVLKIIAFNPESPWLGFDEGLSDVEHQPADIEEINTVNSPPNNITESSSNNSTHNLLYSGEAPEELNPFYAASQRFNSIDHSVSVSTLASHVSPDTSNERQPTPADNTVDVTDVSYAEYPTSENQSSASKAPVAHTPTIEETDPVREDDRGRLFLQINKIANLRGLPIDTGRNPKFTLSLDNGLQTVTTDPSHLPAPGLNGQLSAKVGQEFELTVAKDLELVLTVAVSMDALHPPPKASAPRRMPRHAPTKSTSSSINTASSSPRGGSPIKNMKNLLLRSPKKKQQQQRFQEQQEIEEQNQRLLKLQEEEDKKERQQYERDLKEFYRRSDLWRGITGPHGEYCRGYVFESHYEKDIYGKAKSYSVPLYNEWDKASSQGVPRPVCELQITMMYVPKLYGSEEIPGSMRECQQAIEHTRQTAPRGCEGFLTQQGGDCVSIWRRRWFTLHDAELVAHHEATRKRRSLIHLDRAVSIKDTLSEDLWCIYEDRSFQISFKDGEDISFYADTVEARDTWVQALKDAIDNSHGRHRAWTDLVVEKASLQNNSR